MKLRFLMLAVMLLCAQHIFAQARNVSGNVKDKSTGEGIPGVAVLIENTTKGVFTDISGNFSIQVPGTESALVFSMVGYGSQRIVVGSQTSINVELSEAAMDEVVITALGISRDAKSLGYSSQNVDGSDVATAKEANLVNALQGKVAGVQISGNGNFGGSSRITIRGARSLLGQNQPLFVVDGVPIDNSNFTTTEQERGALGYDYGNAAQDINPADIEDIQVLKGSAAALYGSRGANGVILITTKKGARKPGTGKSPIGVSLNQTYGFEKVLLLPDYQNEYGGGFGDFFESTQFPGLNAHDYSCDCSWGPKLDGSGVLQWYAYDEQFHPELYGKETPYVAHPDNIKDFFQTGNQSSTNISLDGADDNGSFRLSLNNYHQKGIYENSKLNRNTISFSGLRNLTDKFTAGLGVNYVRTDTKGRAQTGYNSLGSNFTQWWQRQLDIEELRDYKNPDGTQRVWNRVAEDDPSPLYWDNPFWVLYENYETDQRERIFGNVYGIYHLTDNIDVKATVMRDYYYDSRQERVAIGSINQSKYSEDDIRFSEMNYEGLVTYKKRLNEDNDLNVFVGVNRRHFDRYKVLSETLGGLLAPNLYTLENASSVGVDSERLTKRVNSGFGGISYGYKGLVYVDITGRNDFSSTLPEENNSYFYPSFSTALIYSELLNLEKLSFGKLRISWASVGNDTDPYRTSTLPVSGPAFGSNGNFYMPNALNNPELKPERINTFEVGTEMSWFSDRVWLDVTYYSALTKDMIFNVSQSAASGSTSAYVNAGEMTNKGIEIATRFIPVRTKDFELGVGFNFGKNTNEVVELSPGINSLRFGQAPFAVFIEARPGEAYGQIVGRDFIYDENGNKVVDEGFYKRTSTLVPLGSYMPNFTGGVSLWADYKGFKLYTLFDFQDGGKFYSLTNTWGKYSGTLIETVENGIRDNGIIVEGVNADGSANTTSVAATDHFFLNGGYVIGAADVYDASFIKFREARLTYQFSPEFLESTPLRNVTVGITGRNLAIITKNVPHIDPEASVSSGNIQGIEGGQLPTTRTIAFILGIQF